MTRGARSERRWRPRGKEGEVHQRILELSPPTGSLPLRTPFSHNKPSASLASAISEVPPISPMRDEDVADLILTALTYRPN
jgi:hypothetical protein